MSISAQQFYDLVALSFAARWNPDKITTMQGRIYSVNWILYHMGIYSEDLRRIFARDPNVANLFARKNDVHYVTNIPGGLRDEVWSEDTHFLIAVRPQNTFRPKRLLVSEGYPLVMTAVGQEYATSIEDRYSSLFSRERFEKATKERKEFFQKTGKARAKRRENREQEAQESE